MRQTLLQLLALAGATPPAAGAALEPATALPRPEAGRACGPRARAAAAVAALPLPRTLPLPLWLRRLLAAESGLWTALLVALPLIAVGLWLLRPPVDPDFWWHLATGRWILAHHQVPSTDPFSWTHAGRPWIAHEWLAELILALADRAGGYAAAVALTGTVTVVGYWLLLRAARLYGASRRMLCLLTLLWGGIPLIYVHVRPQVWGFALLGALIAELVAYDVGRRQRLWALPLLFAFWANLNMNAFIGLACLGVFALDRLVRRRLDRHLVLVCLLCGLAPVLNPRGLDLIRLALDYAKPATMAHYQYIAEWRPPPYRSVWLLPFWLGTPVVALALWKLYRWPPPLWPSLLVLVFFEEALRAARYVPVYGLVLLPFAGWLVWQRRQGLPLITRPLDLSRGPSVPSLRYVLPALLGALAVLAVASRLPWSEFRRSPDARAYPQAAATRVQVLQQHNPQVQLRLFNSYNFGGYLIYRLSPGTKVFVDGRNEMYGDSFMSTYLAVAAAQPGWQDVLSRLGINAVLVEPQAPIAAALAHDADWTLAYADCCSAVYVRTHYEPTHKESD